MARRRRQHRRSKPKLKLTRRIVTTRDELSLAALAAMGQERTAGGRAASAVGQALIHAETAAADASDAIARGDCHGALSRVLGAAGALAAAEAHARAVDLWQAAAEATATHSDVSRAIRNFRRACVRQPGSIR